MKKTTRAERAVLAGPRRSVKGVSEAFQELPERLHALAPVRLDIEFLGDGLLDLGIGAERVDDVLDGLLVEVVGPRRARSQHSHAQANDSYPSSNPSTHVNRLSHTQERVARPLSNCTVIAW